MDRAPLNLAHFHERRAEKFLRHNRYQDAAKALETSLLYLQNAYNFCVLPKSIEVLDTQKWDYERKLQQIQMRKQQHERLKLKEIVPLTDANSVLLRPDHSVTAQSVAKSIDKTIQDFDAKFGSTVQLSKENMDPKQKTVTFGLNREEVTSAQTTAQIKLDQDSCITVHDAKNKLLDLPISAHDLDSDEMPSLAPLELPSFDFNVFTTDTPTLAGLAENFQK